MRPARVLRSGAFRLALVFAAVFGVGAAGLVAGFDTAVAAYAERSTARALERETVTLRATSFRLAPAAFTRFLLRREETEAGEHFRYLLVSPTGARLAGDLPSRVVNAGSTTLQLPEAAEVDDPDEAAEPPGMSTVRLSATRLADGSRLVVGRETFALEDLTRWVNRLTLWTAVGVVVLALAGGYALAALFLARLERVNVAAERIMAGRLDERLPTISVGAEFERLSSSLNAMLDRIEALMGNLRQVTTDIAHDLRTPLTRLRATLEGADAEPPQHDPGRIQALAQLDEVLATFDALLRIGQLEAGAGRGHFEPVDLSAVMLQVAGAYAPAAEDAGKQVTSDLAPAVAVAGDPRLLSQMFANLVENALIHAGANCRVHLRLRRAQGGVLATVSDDGPGIPTPERERVLRRFYRLESSRSTPGAGLGLALVSAIVDLHRAELTLADNAPGLRVDVLFPNRTDLEGGTR